MADRLSIQLLIGGGVSQSLLKSTNQAEKALNGLQNNLRALNQAGKSAKSLADLEKKLDQTRQKLKASSAETAKLAVAMRKVNEPSKELVRSFEKAQKRTQRLKTAFRDQVSSISALRKELRGAGVDTKNLALAQNQLTANLKVVRVAQDRLAAAQSARQANRQAINSLAAQGVEAAALGAGLFAALSPAVKFESAMANVAKVVEFDSTDAVREFGKELQSLSRQIPLTAAELAEIAAAGGRLGLSANDLPDFVAVVSRMATAFDLLPEQAGEAIAKLSNIFDIPIKDIEKLGDAINELANNTAARESDIVDVLTRVGGTSRQFGLVAEETAALADAFLALGRPPQIAATAINALLVRLQTAEAQGAKFQTALSGLGISANELASSIQANPQRALLSFLDSLRDLDNQTRAVTLTNLFGQEFSDDISILVGGLDEYRKALGLISDEQSFVGGVQAEFQKRLQSTEVQLKLLRNTLNEVGVNFGAALLPAINGVAAALKFMAGALADVLAASPEITGAVGVLVGGFISLRVAAVATRLVFALFKQPGLALAEILAGIGARTAAAQTGMSALAAASTVASAGVGTLKASMAGLRAVLIGGGVVGAVSALATGLYLLYDASQQAEDATNRVRENAEKYRDGLRDTEQRLREYAGTHIKSSEQLSRLSKEELASYEERLDKAEQYWRSRALLEHDHTGTVTKETKARKDALLQGLRDLTEHLGNRKTAYRQHVADVEEAKAAETQALEKAFDAQKKIYDKELRKLDQIKSKREAFNESVKELTKTESQPGDDLIKDTVLAPIKELQRGKSALAAGDFEKAEASAKKTVEQLNALKEAGKISSGFLASLSSQASELGNSAFDGLEEQQGDAIESAKQKLQDLKNDAELLKSIQIGFDQASVLDSVESIREQIRQKLEENPIVVPFSAGVGDTPSLSDLPARAAGGPIVGPGPVGKDSVLMWGAPGEHMLTAKEVQAAGGHGAIYRLRQALLRGLIPGFATGGAIERFRMPQINIPQPAMAGGYSGQPLVIDLNGHQYEGTIEPRTGNDLGRALHNEVAKRGRK